MLFDRQGIRSFLVFNVALIIIAIAIGIRLLNTTDAMDWIRRKSPRNKDWKKAYETAVEENAKVPDYALKWPIKGPYEAKGTYITVDGMKTYHTGVTDEWPASQTSKGIIVIYDIFGFKSNTLQGADILAQWPYTNPNKEYYKVFMPDFFEGNTMQEEWYTPTSNEEEKAKAANWWATQGSPAKTVERMPKVITELKKKYPEIKEWGVLGFCWGGKVVSLLTLEKSLFKSAATAHPAFPLPGKASEVTVPILLLPTSGEKKELVDEWVGELKVKNEVMRFDDQKHGFMAAKGDLNDPLVAKGYWEGYLKVLYWFYETL